MLLPLLIVALILLLKPIMMNDRMPVYKAVITQGQLDTSSLSLSDALYELTGEVATYERQLIHDGSGSFKYTSFPYVWKYDEGNYYGSHRFVLKNLKQGELYAFYMLDALTAYNVYVDGKLIASQGKVATSKTSAVPESKTQMALFQAEHSETEVIFQVSNYEAHLTGIWQKTIFGRYENINTYENRVNISDAFMIGAIAFLSIYMWIMYYVLRQDKAIFYFAASCTFVTIKSLLAGQQIGFEAYEMLSYDLGMRMAYLMIPAILCTFVAFAGQCFSNEIRPSYLKVSYVLSGIEAAVILFAPQPVYMGTFLGYQLFIMLSCALLLYWVFIAIKNKRDGALVYLIGFSLFFLFAVNDVLYSMLLIKTGYYLSFGLLILIMSQATIVAIHFLRALKTEEYVNCHLESVVLERTRELEAEKNRFETLSKVDSLTLLYNKGYLTEVLNYEFEGFKRYQSSLAVMMLDLDHFKAVNDTYGHVVGDEVLKQVAEALRQNSRRADIIGRFGGEEFLIIMRFTDLADAVIHADHLRERISQLRFITEKGTFTVTASFGVTVAALSMQDEKELLQLSDDALYLAKSNGRNRVERMCKD